MSRPLIFLVLFSFVGFAPFASAQNPEAKPQTGAAPGQSEAMTAYFGQMFDSLLGYLGKPETAAKIAQMQKSYLDALMKEGFSRQEAMSIITSPNFLRLSSQ